MQPQYNDQGWKTGGAPFTDNAQTAKTLWPGKELWVRRTFNLTSNNFKTPYLKIQYDDDVDVYLNGQLIYQYKGWTPKFKYIPLDARAQKLLKRAKTCWPCIA
jgi:hypothetical protein